MNSATALRLLGRRPIIQDGDITVDGIASPVTIHRDRFGIPHIYADTDFDVTFGIGFCHGQDRSFQIELLQRVTRGTLADLVGVDGLDIDRLSRRIGFARSGTARLEHLTSGQLDFVTGYAAGVNAGRSLGSARPQHEFSLLRSTPTTFTTGDALGILALVSFFLASNWDAELARLHVLMNDGEAALRAIDPAYPHWHHVTSPPGTTSGPIEQLTADITALQEWIGIGGASNAWAVSGSRTTTGRPILANDPHLGPLLPPHWYLCHMVTPDWAVAGASFVGGPTLASGHNGFAAWGVTAGLVDNTDLFIEHIDDDGTVRGPGGPETPTRLHEVISVRGGESVVEEVIITARGPIIGPALEGDVDSISMRATWLEPAPLDGLFSLHRVSSFDDLRRTFAHWPAASFGLVYADADGTIGYTLAGDVPRRSGGDGMLPQPAWVPGADWTGEKLDQAALPHETNPAAGWVATANNRPSSATDPDLGHDFLDGYRVGRIVELLEPREDWDIRSTMAAQLDQRSGPWAEIKEPLLAALRTDHSVAHVVAMLEAWDGIVSADSPEATMFELLWTELDHMIVRSKAPVSAEWILGRGFNPMAPFGLIGFRRGNRIVALVRERPDGWFDKGWDAAIVAAARAAHARLTELTDQRWGWARPLWLRHPLGVKAPLDKIFNLGPIPWGGDGSTVSQSGADPIDPLNPLTLAIASVRTIIDVGEWERCRFVLPGGQSGNRLSRHYDDQLHLWRNGDAVPIAWSDEAVADVARSTLRLEPRKA